MLGVVSSVGMGGPAAAKTVTRVPELASAIALDRATCALPPFTYAQSMTITASLKRGIPEIPDEAIV
jgi:hypothetical protein